MDYTSYVYIIIALTPFIVWATVIFALANEERSTKNIRFENTADIYNEESFAISIIPYGLVFPLYYRSSASHSVMG